MSNPVTETTDIYANPPMRNSAVQSTGPSYMIGPAGVSFETGSEKHILSMILEEMRAIRKLLEDQKR